MAQIALPTTSFATSYTSAPHSTASPTAYPGRWATWQEQRAAFAVDGLGSTGKGILIGILSAFGSAAFVGLIIAGVYFFRYTNRGRILLDRIGRPGEYDDEQQFLREEEDALAAMDEGRRGEYMRAKAFVTANPPESLPTDISLSQFLAIQEKGVSAWEFEPELEIANCFVEARTEIEFFDATCSVQSNLPIPKQNEVYYFEAKIYDKPETTLISIGLTTKPYPLFRLPGFHKHSIAYTSSGSRRYNQPFTPFPYGPAFVQGDVIGVGYRPRTGTIFFTRNGKKLEDLAHGLKSQNFFPTVGADGPCIVHVNFGQAGFVFIEANVKKWGLAPMTGSLAPPPPYGSEQGSILLEGGRDGVREGQAWIPGHARTSSAQMRLGRGPMTRSPGPERSPTEISLAPFNLQEERVQEIAEEDEDEEEYTEYHDDAGEGTSSPSRGLGMRYTDRNLSSGRGEAYDVAEHEPPAYSSPEEEEWTDQEHAGDSEEGRHMIPRRGQSRNSPPIPSYEVATGEGSRGRSA